MQLKFFAVSVFSLAIGVNSSALPRQVSASRHNPSPPENILAEAHSYVDADIEEIENEDDKYDHSDFYAQAYAAAFGDDTDASILAESEAAAGCTALTSSWSCVSSPIGCVYKDQECVKE